jgi:cell division control protein 24
VKHDSTNLQIGNYTIQIFWKGDPGVEHFIIKFKNEDTMLKWNREIEAQRAVWAESMRASRANGTSETQFTSLRGLHMENPHQEYEFDDDDYNRAMQGNHLGYENGNFSEFSLSRNASSLSLRSSSTNNTNGGMHNPYPQSSSRPSRFPLPDPSSLPPLNTSFQTTPGERAGGTSYFSPVERETTTPMTASARTSSQSAFTGYDRYGAPSNGWSNGEEHTNRNTAPAMSRANRGANPYMMNGRDPRMRPSLPPVSTAPPTAQQLANGINRMRAASSPDFTNPQRRVPNGLVVPNGSDVPTVPAIPPHVAGRVAPINRSMNSSPTGMPPRSNTPSANGHQYGLPPGPRPQMTNHYTYDSSYNCKMDPRMVISNLTPGSSISTIDRERNLSPPLSTPSSDGEPFMPSQLKAKVCFDNNYITLVIASNIQFRSLTDRIDAKLARFTQASIGGGSVRLRYRDEDGDYIWIDSDEAVNDAFLDWRETHADKIATGSVGEILLFCSSLNGDPLTASG